MKTNKIQNEEIENKRNDETEKEIEIEAKIGNEEIENKEIEKKKEKENEHHRNMCTVPVFPVLAAELHKEHYR